MKKIISTAAMVCLSFSCFAEDYFVKIAANEYVLQHGEKSINLGFNSRVYGAIVQDAVYTPTHIFTYPDGNPAQFRNIQKIEYTESKVTFVKDMKSRKCCIDVLDDKEGKNKCRIIGVNGHNIGSFEVYEVAEGVNSFTDSKSRLIFVDHSGLYIVEKDKNSVEDVSKNHFKNGSFDFEGEIIKISAVDGKVSDEAYRMLAFKEVEVTPVMKQIEEITGVMPQTPPPSEKAALKRMAEILDVPVELLVFRGEQVKMASLMRRSRGSHDCTSEMHSFFIELGRIIPIEDYSRRTWVTINGVIFAKALNYKFDTSPEAQQRRREIALKSWDE